MRRNWIKLLVCAALIATFALAPVSALAKGTAKILIVSRDDARLRSRSDINHVLTTLKKGTRVVYAGKRDGQMYLVRTAKGQVGYIYKMFLSAYGAAASNRVYKVSKKAPVYKNQHGHPKKIGSLSAGTTVIVYEVRGGWAYVKTLKGKSCYIKTAYLKQA